MRQTLTFISKNWYFRRVRLNTQRLFTSRNVIEILSNLRTRALRKRIWFQSLTDQDRILCGLITRHVKIVNNATLATVIARILGKLISGLQNSFLTMIDRIGRPIAESSYRAAHAMGWVGSSKWINDQEIVRWYGFSAYYSNMRLGGNVW